MKNKKREVKMIEKIIKQKILKTKEKEEKKIEGIFSEKDFIRQSYIDVTNPK